MQSQFTFENINEFTKKTTKLLKEEQEHQKQMFNEMVLKKSIHQIEQQGAGLSNMTIINTKQGFYGKNILTIVKSYSSQKNKIKLPEHCKLQVGDDVAIYRNNSIICQGIVYKKTNQKIKVSISSEDEEALDFQGLKVNLILKWNQVTFRRYFEVLQQMVNPVFQNTISFLLFPETSKNYISKKHQLFQNKKMNEKQRQAVANGLIQSCHLIHGPPGTGKTTTLCELIIEAVKKGQKILACAPSNVAVDNIVEGIGKRVRCVRIGNPARVTSEVLQKCLDYQVGACDNLWKNELKTFKNLKKKISKVNNKIERKALYKQIKQIQKQISNLQQQSIQEILQDSDVICATNVGAADRIFRKYLSKKNFDLVVIDQCGQALEISCWIPLLKGKRVVLAGDHKQLPPTIKYQQNSLLSFTLFSRAMTQLKYISSTMLEVQYRMNKDIMGWSNKLFYDGRLKAHESVQNHELKQLYKNVENQATVMFIDTAGCKMGEQGDQNESKINKGEADIIISLYKKLLQYQVSAKDIAILTPYSKQVSFIKNIIYEQQIIIPEISTVDGIQGRQKECILISLVRSNPNHEIGFLKDWRRMNVAVTRARRMLIVVGDSDSVKKDKVLSQLFDWIEERGEVQSAFEFNGDPKIRFGIGKIQKEQEIKKERRRKKNKGKQKNQKINQEKKEVKIKNISKYYEHDEQEQDALKEKYSCIFKTLQEQVVFHNLTSFQRKMIHQVAQQFGLFHETSSDKKEIRIRLIKKEPTPIIEEFKKDESSIQINLNQDKEQEKANQKKNHKLMQNEGDRKKLTKKQEETKKVKNKKQKKKQLQEDDIDNLLQQFLGKEQIKNICYKCDKKLSSVRKMVCKFCTRQFCQYHLLAEQHGCDEEAHQNSRRQKVDKFIEDGSKKIKEKLKDQEDKRKKKVKQK